MGSPVLKVWMARLTDAGHQLSQEEWADLTAKRIANRDELGGKNVVAANVGWSCEEWYSAGVEEWPSVEAMREHTMALAKMGWYRYFESKVMMGTRMGEPE